MPSRHHGWLDEMFGHRPRPYFEGLQQEPLPRSRYKYWPGAITLALVGLFAVAMLISSAWH